MRVVVFDGVCNMCNEVVDFVLAHERGPTLQFLAVQSEMARTLLAERGVTLPDGVPSTIYLIDDEVVYDRSTAALRIARELKAPWSWGYLFRFVPRFIRDLGYRYAAKRRYLWFGKRDACRLATPELRARFL